MTDLPWRPDPGSLEPRLVVPDRRADLGPGVGLEVAVEEGAPTFPASVEDLVNAAWAEKKAAMPFIFDGPLWALRSYSERRDPPCLRVSLQQTSYRYKMFAKDLLRSQAELRDPDLGRLVEAVQPIGIGVLVFTSDGSLCLGLRGDKTAVAAGMWHMIGGVLDAPDPLSTALQELQEELGVPPEHAGRDSVEFLGLWNTGEYHGWIPCLVFAVSIAVTAEQLERDFWPNAEDHWEHVRLGFLDPRNARALEELEAESRAAATLLTRRVVQHYSRTLPPRPHM